MDKKIDIYELAYKCLSEYQRFNVISRVKRNEYGYTSDVMLAMDKFLAAEMFQQGKDVYKLYPDNTESQAMSADEIMEHDGIFGIEDVEVKKMAEEIIYPFGIEKVSDTCEYCKTRDLIKGYNLNRYFENKSFLDITLDPDQSENPCMNIHIRINNKTILDESISINYCPMCGRKLRVQDNDK